MFSLSDSTKVQYASLLTKHYTLQSCFWFTLIRMPNCPKCNKPVYFAERKTSLGKDWHGACLRCEKCNKTLIPGGHAEHEGKPYCHNPCYSALYGPGGFGRGGAESYVYNNK